jgi:uncharacterized glyoxalase superfamily protein PhnB
MSQKYIPDGYTAVSPFFIVRDAASLIHFMQQAFDAKELSRQSRPDGTVMHATLAIDGSVVMIGTRDFAFQNSTHLYVKDVDATYRRSLALGAESISEPKTFSYGDRTCGIKDPFGNTWWIGTHRAFLQVEQLEDS